MPHVADSTLTMQLQNILDQGVQALNLMGASVAVHIPGQNTWAGASGLSDPVSGEGIRPDMLLSAGSITKNMVAALMLDLAEDGLLTLDDSLGQWLPVYPNINSGITIRQLLNHSSGLFDFTDHPAYLGAIFADFERQWTPEDVVSGFVEPPLFAPGTGQDYSNTNYVLAGMIIEQATGSKVSDELRDRFFTPLNLTQTFLRSEEDLIGDLAHHWLDIDEDGQLDDLSAFSLTSVWTSTWTAGAIFSTAADIVHWGHALFSGQVLTQASLDEMLEVLPIMNYGLGMYSVELQDRVLWGHDGGGAGYNALMLYEPQDGICISVMLNIDEGNLPVSGSNYILLDALLAVALNYVSTDVETLDAGVPSAFDLRPNYPNPFNPSTTIAYQLRHPAHVTLTIHNARGQEVRTLVKGLQTQGMHRVHWDGTNTYGERAASGLYLYRMHVGDQVQTQKMMLVK